MPAFKLVTDIRPKGDQPKAIRAIAAGVERGERFQTLLGVTGSDLHHGQRRQPRPEAHPGHRS